MRQFRSMLLGSVAPLWDAAGEGGAGGGAGGDGTGAGDPGSVLFPGDKPTGDGEGDKGDGDKAGEWKEYEPDPNKSDAENAAAKAEHDKGKPADKGDNKAAADKVPDDGKYELKMPEGVEVDTELLDALGPEFKEIGLTQGQAQKLADKFIAINQARAERHAEQPEGQWSMAAYGYFKEHGTPDQWADQAKADKDMGGDKWDATVANAMRFVNSAGTPALRDYLNASGGGNHPEVIRAFAKAGAMIREDDPASGGAEGSGKPADAAHVLFPNDKPEG